MLLSWWSRLTSRRQRVSRRVALRVECLETRAVPAVFKPNLTLLPSGGPGPTGSGYTPSQIRHAYGYDLISYNSGTVVGDGSGQTIAIVTAFDNPRFVNTGDSGFATSDLRQFDQAFGIADPPSFQKVNLALTHTTPATPTADQLKHWTAETALDVEWAHALAPAANILLVEANSDTDADLLSEAVAYASDRASVVTMSFGVQEFDGETAYDSLFGGVGVTYVAASGDLGLPPEYPAASPNVLAVGGTSLTLADATGTYGSETAWSSSNGGWSSYETQPAYQSALVPPGSPNRGGPDVAFDADPGTGVAVYDSLNNGDSSGPWSQAGGTSLGAPAWAALMAIVNQGHQVSDPNAGTISGVNPLIYQLPSTDFHDITTGRNQNFTAGPGFDLVTGRGTPNANLIASDLSGANITISGQAFTDDNADGKLNGAEQGQDLVQINLYLDANHNNTFDPGTDPLVLQATTGTVNGVAGVYAFTNLGPGTYFLQEPAGQATLQGYSPTGADVYPVTVSSGDSIAGPNFGNFHNVTLQGVVYGDTNGDGVQDNGETGLLGAIMQLVQGGTTLQSVNADSNGTYTFSNVGPGTYQVQQGPHSGFVQTSVNPATITVPGALAADDLSFGNFQASIAGRVFQDTNGDGSQDNGESGLAGWSVQLFLAGDPTPVGKPASTSSTGDYKFSELAPGTYDVRLTPPLRSGWHQTSADPAAVTVNQSGSFTGGNIGVALNATLQGAIFEDFNGNGSADAGEPVFPIADGVSLYNDTNGNGRLDAGDTLAAPAVMTGTTAATLGHYSFANVRPGQYLLVANKLPGYDLTLGVRPVTVPLQSGLTIGGQDFTTLASPNATFVFEIYQQLLHRPVDGGGLVYWSGVLNSGVPRAQVLQLIEGTREYQTIQINDLYETYLNRAVDAGGLAYSLQLLNSPGVNALDQLRTVILTSSEYLRVQGVQSRGNDSFVAALYQSLLGRTMDAGGQAFFVGELDNKVARATVVQQLVASAEAKQLLVKGYYQTYLDRSADLGGLTGFSTALQQGVKESSVIQAILASDEYFRNL